MPNMKNYIKVMESVMNESHLDEYDDDTLLGFVNSPGSIEFLMRKEDVEDIAQPGSNDAAVAQVVKKPYIRYQLDDIGFETIKEHVHEAMPDFEAEDSQDATQEDYEQRLIWDIAWTIRDDDEVATEDDYIDSFVQEIRSKM